MAGLTDAILELFIVDTTESLPADLLSFYRNPPGRKPHPHSLRIKEALAGMSDEAAMETIRAVIDATVFNMLHLIDSEFRGEGIEIMASQGGDRVRLSGSGLHELYRTKVNPGGSPPDQN